MAAREQAVREREAGKPENPPEVERDEKTATSGDQENMDLETTGDRHTKPSSVQRRRKKSNDEGQGRPGTPG
jgi:hypothetical protein